MCIINVLENKLLVLTNLLTYLNLLKIVIYTIYTVNPFNFAPFYRAFLILRFFVIHAAAVKISQILYSFESYDSCYFSHFAKLAKTRHKGLVGISFMHVMLLIMLLCLWSRLVQNRQKRDPQFSWKINSIVQNATKP